MDTKTYLLCELLRCGCLDVYYLSDLCDKNDIELDIECIRQEYWKININILIYNVLYQIAEEFIAENQEEICNILEITDLNEYISNNDLYETFINCIDSHLRFKDEEIQALFEKSKYQV